MIYRSALGLYVFLVLALGAFAVSVNVMDVEGSVYLRGYAEFEGDHTQGMRGLFQYSPTGETLHPESMQWRFQDPDDESLSYPVDFIAGSATDAWPDLTFRLPDDIGDGSYLLQMETSHKKVRHLSASREVEVRRGSEPASTLGALPWPDFVPRDDESEARRSIDGSGEVALAITPPDGELVRSHKRSVILRSFNAETGQPIPATLTIDVVEGIVEEELKTTIHTDSLGFASLDVKPMTDLEFAISLQPAPRRVIDPDYNSDDGAEDELPSQQFSFRLNAVSAGFTLRPTSRVVTREDQIETSVASTIRNSTYMVDLYDGERLLDTLTLSMNDRLGGARFAAPDPAEVSPFLRVQTYQSIFGTSHGWDSYYVLVLEDDSDQSLRDAATELFTWIDDHADSVHHRYIADIGLIDELSTDDLYDLIEAGLLEVPRTFEVPPVFMNTRQTDREDLADWRAEVRKDIQLMMGLLLLVGFIVASYFVVVGIRRHLLEGAALRAVELETDEDFPQHERRPERLERLVTVLQGAIVFLTLMGFALGILIVVSYL